MCVCVCVHIYLFIYLIGFAEINKINSFRSRIFLSSNKNKKFFFLQKYYSMEFRNLLQSKIEFYNKEKLTLTPGNRRY